MSRQGTPTLYPIRAVSRLTGIGIDTLRAWERRHGAVTPARDDRGRLYTDADVARLQLLQRVVGKGHSIGRLAGLSDKALRQLDATPEPVPPSATAPRTGRRAPVDTASLADALREFDAVGIDQALARLAVSLRPLELLRDVLMPTLVQVGDDWQHGRVGIAHEHLMSSTMRNIMGGFLRLYARTSASARLLFATPSGERHEIGTLGSAMLAASRGLNVLYLGPDLPARDIVDSAMSARARVVVLGLTARLAGPSTGRALRAIVRDLPRGVELWAGGPGAASHARLIQHRGMILTDYDAFERQLDRISASTPPDAHGSSAVGGHRRSTIGRAVRQRAPRGA